MTSAQYIELEVRSRLHDEMFTRNDERLKKMEAKLNWIITLIVSGVLLPAVLRVMQWA
jgi:hypothetical protein